MHDGARIPAILVVGGGLAATALAGSLRAGGFAGRIVVASDETRLPYDRPPLTKELFTRDSPVDLCTDLGLDPAAVEWRLGLRATRLRAGAVEFADADGRSEVLAADAVVLATGARPAPPPAWQGVHVLSTWDDAQRLRSRLTPGAGVVVVGAGWIGLELAGTATAAGARVTLVDGAARPLGTLLPAPVGARIATWLADAGVTLVPRGVSGASATGVRLDGGTHLPADVVVAAVGARPATGWLPGRWLAPSGHVRVDDRQAVADGLWAIGDCAAVAGLPDQHWNAAVASAQRCAAAILGTEPPARRAPTVFSAILGRAVDLVGRPSPALDVVWREERGWTALLFQGDALAAGLAVDRPRDVAALRRLLADGPVRLGRDTAADPARPLRDALPA